MGYRRCHMINARLGSSRALRSIDYGLQRRMAVCDVLLHRQQSDSDIIFRAEVLHQVNRWLTTIPREQASKTCSPSRPKSRRLIPLPSPIPPNKISLVGQLDKDTLAPSPLTPGRNLHRAKQRKRVELRCASTLFTR